MIIINISLSVNRRPPHSLSPSSGPWQESVIQEGGSRGFCSFSTHFLYGHSWREVLRDRAVVLGSPNLAHVWNSFTMAPWTHQNPTWLVTLGLVVWVQNVTHGPICLNTWSLDGGSVLEWKAIKLLRERGSCWGRDLRVDSSAPLPVCSLLPDCVCNVTSHLIL